MPHTETQGNTIATDINVDGQHQKRLYSLLCDNPFGSQLSLAFDDWESLYKLVSNMAEKNRRRRSSISAIYKVGMGLQMQGPPEWSYKFRPQHIIHDELCMELQKRVFKLKDSGDVLEIPLKSYNPRSPNQVLVREIAFGKYTLATRLSCFAVCEYARSSMILLLNFCYSHGLNLCIERVWGGRA